MWIRILYVLGLFNAHLVVFGIFLPKTEEKQLKIPIVNNKGRRGRGGQPMWIIVKFDNIIIKSANVDKGGGGKTLINKMWIKRRV